MAELMHVQGLTELKRALQALPKNISRNVLRASVNAGARVVRDQARIYAPMLHVAIPKHQPPGTLKRSIITAYIPEKSNVNQATYYVTVRQGKRYRGQGRHQNRSQDAFYGAWVELGHYYVPPKPHGDTWKKHRAEQHATGMFIPPHPYLRPAFEVKKVKSVEAMRDYLLTRLPQEIEKARRS